jgi:methylmalonyl-CoA mutase N-terminal domain/subunit
VIEAIEAGFLQREIADASYRYQRSVESGERVIVGVNGFRHDSDVTNIELLKIGREIEAGQIRDVALVRTSRNDVACKVTLEALESTCASDANIMPALIDAVRALATEGEIVERMVKVFGRYVERASF